MAKPKETTKKVKDYSLEEKSVFLHTSAEDFWTGKDNSICAFTPTYKTQKNHSLSKTKNHRVQRTIRKLAYHR